MKNGFLILILLVAVQNGHAQNFVNLDFEDANILVNQAVGTISAAEAFPSWTVMANYILCDDISLSGNSISIFDTKYVPAIQGNYFANLLGPGATSYIVSIGQTGQIPDSTQSIIFWGNDEGLQVTFNGQPLDFQVTGSTANYNI